MYFSSLNADEVNIKDTSIYTIRLKAKEGWQFDVDDNTDVTGWFVNEAGEPVFVNNSGIAFAVNGEDFELDITVDASKIEGFSTNGSADFYVMPNGGIPLVVEGITTDSMFRLQKRLVLIRSRRFRLKELWKQQERK
ncbi:MAG: hypothetical protein ACLU9T_07140 [Blautia faecis]